jgi:hypothetical protein
MLYGNVPVIIPVLAGGYLFIVYLLLTLARRSGASMSNVRSRDW